MIRIVSHVQRLLLSVVFFFAAAFSVGNAQQELTFNSGAEKSFLDATQLFKNGKFSDAASGFDELRRLKPWHQRTTGAYVMLAKAWFELKKYEESALLLQEFLGMFPASTYRDDATYTLALDHLMAAKFDVAAAEVLQALESAGDPSLARRAGTLFADVGAEGAGGGAVGVRGRGAVAAPVARENPPVDGRRAFERARAAETRRTVCGGRRPRARETDRVRPFGRGERESVPGARTPVARQARAPGGSEDRRRPSPDAGAGRERRQEPCRRAPRRDLARDQGTLGPSGRGDRSLDRGQGFEA